MKKTLYLAGLLLVASVAMAQEQSTASFGLKTGLNLSIFSASVNSEPAFRPAIHLGFYGKVPMKNKFYFRPELYYSGQGQKTDYVIPSSGQSVGSTTTSLNYLNIALLSGTGGKFSFEFGPQVGFLLSSREKGTIDGEEIDDDLKDVMRPIDLSLVLGLAVRAGETVDLGVRLNYGINDIYKADDEINMSGFDYPAIKNRVIQFFIGYTF